MTVMLNACNVIKVWVLQATPWYAILLLFTIACCYIAYNTFKVIVRFYVMASILILPMALLIALGFSRADFSYIFPITEAGWWNIIQASKETITAMYGFEIILIAFPKVNGSSVAKLKAISIANGFVTLFILLLFGFALSYLVQNKLSLFQNQSLTYYAPCISGL